MKPKPIVQDQELLFRSRLSEQLNPKHELLRLVLLPSHPQETEVFLRQIFWVDQKYRFA